MASSNLTVPVPLLKVPAPPPFNLLKACDNTSTGSNAESEHILGRFAQNSLNMSQVANDYWNVSMRIEEEF